MLIALLCRWVCNVCSYLYPAYASYKALSVHPDSSPEAMMQVERWLMYWAVVGTWTAVEAIMGWTFTWLPFYSLIKTAIFLYFSLPQSEGSTYIYRSYLAPFFHENESDIDAFLASLRTRATTALASGVGWLWEKAKAQLNLATDQQGLGSGTQQQDDGVQGFAVPGVQQPPSLQDPASGAMQQMYGLVSRYAGHYMPVAITALTAAAGAAQARVQHSQVAQAQSRVPSQVRAEQVPESMAMPVPVPTPGVRTSSDGSLRSRTWQHASSPSAGYANLAPGQGVASAQASGRLNRDVQPQHLRSASNPSRPSPASSSNPSEESISHASRWSGEMSYESIAREEAQGAPVNGDRQAWPGMEQRRSSWWGWGAGGTPEKPKAE
ncbi:hypothetical protein IAU60_005273 [Kwoniella sp. DSM 27419]